MEQGRVFRPSLYEISQALHVSIPLEQGGVFRPFLTLITAKRHMSFNPFGAGQGLSTGTNIVVELDALFQSLWNRAGSFDPVCED